MKWILHFDILLEENFLLTSVFQAKRCIRSIDIENETILECSIAVCQRNVCRFRITYMSSQPLSLFLSLSKWVACKGTEVDSWNFSGMESFGRSDVSGKKIRNSNGEWMLEYQVICENWTKIVSNSFSPQFKANFMSSNQIDKKDTGQFSHWIHTVMNGMVSIPFFDESS